MSVGTVNWAAVLACYRRLSVLVVLPARCCCCCCWVCLLSTHHFAVTAASVAGHRTTRRRRSRVTSHNASAQCTLTVLGLHLDAGAVVKQQAWPPWDRNPRLAAPVQWAQWISIRCLEPLIYGIWDWAVERLLYVGGNQVQQWEIWWTKTKCQHDAKPSGDIWSEFSTFRCCTRPHKRREFGKNTWLCYEVNEYIITTSVRTF